MESHLWLALNVHSLCADLAMSMKEERETKLALSAKPDTSAIKVRLQPTIYSHKSIIFVQMDPLLALPPGELWIGVSPTRACGAHPIAT